MESSDILIDGNIVVIENDEQVGITRSGVVKSLKSKASGKRTVADQGHCLMRKSLKFRRLRKTESCGDGSRRMTCAKGIVRAFRTLRETAYAILHPVLAECLATAGDELMGIGLVTHIEDKLVLRGVIDIVKTHHKFDGTEARAEMSRIHGTALDHVMTYLSTELAKLIHAEILDIRRAFHPVQKSVRHLFLFHKYNAKSCEVTKKSLSSQRFLDLAAGLPRNDNKNKLRYYGRKHQEVP